MDNTLQIEPSISKIRVLEHYLFQYYIKGDKNREFPFFGRERQIYPKDDIRILFEIDPFFTMLFNKEYKPFHRSHTQKVNK